MPDTEKNYFTPEGYEKLKEKLNKMKGKDRREIAKQIEKAKEKGDLSENAEYEAAKDEQAMLEKRIAELEKKVANAKILDKENVDTSQVRALCKVELKNLQNDQKLTYEIVPDSESNVKKGKISVKTPIAQGLMGKKEGDTAEIEVPNGTMKFKILDISI